MALPTTARDTQFLRLMTLADQRGLDLAPHFAMEIHLHLAACYPPQPWAEHFDWLDPLFNERLETKDGRMPVPDRPGLGITLSEQARAWTTASVTFGQRWAPLFGTFHPEAFRIIPSPRPRTR